MSMLRNLPFSGDFPVSLRFGESQDLFKRVSFKGVPLLGHPGLDFDLPLRTPVLAVQHGVVLDVRSDPDGYGDSVLLSHRWGQTFYAHLSEVRVEKGQQAAAGQTIGLSGDSGVIDQPTMHFGMRLIPYSIDDGWCGFTDPTPYLARLTQPRGAIIGPHIIGSIRPHLEVLSRWRPRMITLLDPSPDDLLALRDVCPDSTIVARIFVPDHEMSERINKDPVEAAHWAHEITETRMAYGVDYWQVANEVHQDHDGLRKLNQFELTRMALADEAGYRCAILAFSVGNPDLPENDRMAVWKHVYPALAHAEEKGHVVALHQYGMPDLWGPNNAYDWYIYRLEHQVLRRLPFRQLKFAVTEYGIDGLIRGNEASGWQNFTTPEGYVEQLLKCGRYLERFSGQVLGYTIFTLGHYNPWQSYDIIGKAAAYLADLSEKGTWREIDAQVYDIVPRETDNTTDVGPTIIASMIPPEEPETPEEPADESDGNPPPAPDATSEEFAPESAFGSSEGDASDENLPDGGPGGFDDEADVTEASTQPDAEPDAESTDESASDTETTPRKSRRRRRQSSAATAKVDEAHAEAEVVNQSESLDTADQSASANEESENEFIIPSAMDAFNAEYESISAQTSETDADSHPESTPESTEESAEAFALADDEQEALEDVMPADANAVEPQQPTALLDPPESETTARHGAEPVEANTQVAEGTEGVQDDSATESDTLASIIAAMSGDNAADAEDSDADHAGEEGADAELSEEPPAEPTRTAPLFEQRIALPFAAYNMRIEAIQTRPDQPLAGQGPLVNESSDVDEVVYLVKDLFMTYYGSWEPSGEYESVPDWARDDYLRPSFLEAGADHHLFAAVIGLDGEMRKGHEIVFWSDGFERLGDSSYGDYTRENTKESSGWANLFMAGGSSYVPQRGDTGPWCWAPAGAAEVVVGGGLPVGHPVSTFVVWQAVLRSDWEATLKPETETPVEPPPPTEPAEPTEPTPPEGGGTTTTPTPKIEVERRISDWIPHYNVSVQPLMARPDQPTGDVVYILKDLFTTASGSWEHNDLPGSVPEWARDEYLKPAGSSDYFDDAGGDHHLFAAVIGLDGKLIRNHEIVYWSDGFEMLGDPDYKGYVRRMTKERSGWANVITGPGSSFVPERNESGPWCWAPAGAAEVVCGGGLPLNHHISFFAVWQAVPASEGGTPDNGKDDWNNETFIPTVPKEIKPSASDQFPPVDANAMVVHMYRQAAWNRLGLELPVDSFIAAYARRNRLGRPVTQEFELNGQRIQGYNEAIVCMPVGQPQAITHIPW